MAIDTFLVLNNAPGAEINFDVQTASNQHYNATLTRNIVVNYRGSGSTTLASLLNNQIWETRLLIINDSRTKFIVSGFKVDGVFHYPLWLNATSPKTGTSSRLAEYLLRFYKDSNNTVQSLAQLILYAR